MVGKPDKWRVYRYGVYASYQLRRALSRTADVSKMHDVTRLAMVHLELCICLRQTRRTAQLLEGWLNRQMLARDMQHLTLHAYVTIYVVLWLIRF